MNTLAQVYINQIFRSPYGRGKGLADFVSVVLSNAVAFAGVILFILMIVGGITIMVGAGNGDKEGIAKGKKALTTALIGFLIVFTAYWIIIIIERTLSIDILTP